MQKSKIISLKLKNINTVTNFVSANTRSKCKVTVKSGRYILDGDSIMSMFCLDLTRPYTVKITGMEDDIESLIMQYTLFGMMEKAA